MLATSLVGESPPDNALLAKVEEHFRLIDVACARYGGGSADGYHQTIQAAGDLLTGLSTPLPRTPKAVVLHDTPPQPPSTIPNEKIFWTEADLAPSQTLLKLVKDSSQPSLPEDIGSLPPLKELPTPEEISAAYKNQIAARERRERTKFRAAFAAGMLALTGMFGITPTGIALTEVLRPSTSTEAAISDTVQNSLGETVMVRCMSPEKLRAFPGDSETGKAIPYSRILLVRDNLCEIFADYIRNPVSYEEAMQDPAAKERLKAAILAANVIAHEETHAVDGTANESKTQCLTVRKLPEIIATAAGDSHPSKDLIHFVTATIKEFMDSAATGEHAEYAVDPACYDGLLK